MDLVNGTDDNVREPPNMVMPRMKEPQKLWVAPPPGERVYGERRVGGVLQPIRSDMMRHEALRRIQCSSEMNGSNDKARRYRNDMIKKGKCRITFKPEVSLHYAEPCAMRYVAQYLERCGGHAVPTNARRDFLWMIHGEVS